MKNANLEKQVADLTIQLDRMKKLVGVNVIGATNGISALQGAENYFFHEFQEIALKNPEMADDSLRRKIYRG